MRRKLILGLVLFLLFIVAFVVSILVFFPMNSVKHYVEKNAETKAFKNEQSVVIKDLKVSPLLNVTATDIRITPLNPAPIEDNMRMAGGNFGANSEYYCAPYAETSAIVIDKLFINPSVISSAKGNPNGAAEIELAGGILEITLNSIDEETDSDSENNENAQEAEEAPKKRGKAAKDGDENADAGNKKGAAKARPQKPISLAINAKTAELSDISLSDFALISNMTGFQIYGQLSGEADVVINKSNLDTALAKFTVASTAMCPKRIKIPKMGSMTMDLPFIEFGDIDADIEYTESKIQINSLTSTGPDITLNISGSVSIPKQKHPNSKAAKKLDITAHIGISEQWLTKNSMEIIYNYCHRNDDNSVDMRITGSSDKPSLDCGTPSPVPKPVVEKKVEPKKEEVKKEEKKPEVKKPEPEPAPEMRPPRRPPRGDRPERFDRGDRPEPPDFGNGEDFGGRGSRPNRRADRPGSRPFDRAVDLENDDRIPQRQREQMQQINDNVRREYGRRRPDERGRNFGPPMDRD